MNKTLAFTSTLAIAAILLTSSSPIMAAGSGNNLRVIGSIQSPNGSGIYGQVTIGPTCPTINSMSSDQSKCADHPYQARISAWRRIGNYWYLAGLSRSNQQGNYQERLRPGSYLIIASPLNQITDPNRPSKFHSSIRCEQREVTVNRSSYTKVNLSCDSGLR